MKNLGGKTFLCLVAIICATSLFMGFTPHTTINPISNNIIALSNNSTPTSFPDRVNSISRYNRTAVGIYIYRSEWANVPGNFIGDVHIDPMTFPGLTNWDFKATHLIDGEFQPTSAFLVDRTNEGVSATFLFPKNAKAGLYAIRASAMNSDGTPVLEYGIPLVMHYYILYAEEFSYITLTDMNPQNQSNRHNLRAQGASRELQLRVSANAGAMDKASMLPLGGPGMGNLFNVDIATINPWEMNFTVTRNGAVSTAIQVEPTLIWTETGRDFLLNVTIPASLDTGAFTITARHPMSNQVLGTFVIDNRVMPAGGGNLSGLGVFFLILGILLVAGAAFIYAAPKIIHARQQKAYDKVQDSRHHNPHDVDKVDKRFKAQSANDALKGSMERLEGDPKEPQKTKRQSSFLSKMHESKQRREWAREQGLTMDEFREIEAARLKVEEAKESSLSGIRGTTKIVEEVQKPKQPGQSQAGTSLVSRLADGTEFDMLDSVREKSATADSDYQQNVVQPNQEGAIGSGILGRLRAATEGGTPTPVDAPSGMDTPPPFAPPE